MIRNKTILRFLLMCFIMLMSFSVYAETTVDGVQPSPTAGVGELNTQETANLDDPEKKTAMQNTILSIFSDETYSSYNVAAGVRMAAPVINLIMVLSVALVAIVCYAFFGQTGIDLVFIIIPMSRGFLYKKTSENGSHNGMAGGVGSSFLCLSEAALEAVGYGSSGNSGGMMGGASQDRAVGSGILKYATTRTKELGAFVCFVLMFFGGILNNIVLALFNFFYGIIAGLLMMTQQVS